MEVNYEAVVDGFTEFVMNWRVGKERLPEALSGDSLVNFVTDLQNKILNEISFQGKGNLVLYSGVPYLDGESMCKGSNGKYYMISQTEAGKILWDEELRDAVSKFIKTLLSRLLVMAKNIHKN